jgi:hypothetical protein
MKRKLNVILICFAAATCEVCCAGPGRSTHSSCSLQPLCLLVGPPSHTCTAARPTFVVWSTPLHCIGSPCDHASPLHIFPICASSACINGATFSSPRALTRPAVHLRHVCRCRGRASQPVPAAAASSIVGAGSSVAWTSGALAKVYLADFRLRFVRTDLLREKNILRKILCGVLSSIDPATVLLLSL